jgi:hypothetical protein
MYFGFYKCISANDSVFRLFESPQREEMHMKDNTKTKLHKINNKILRLLSICNAFAMNITKNRQLYFYQHMLLHKSNNIYDA